MPNTEGVDLPLAASNRTVTLSLLAINSAGIRYSTSKKRICCSGTAPRSGLFADFPAVHPSTSQALGPRFSLLYVTTNVSGCARSTGRS